MSSRKRARRSDQNTMPTKKPTTSSNSAPEIPLPAGSHSALIFAVPPEIWLEILSFLPSVQIPTRRISHSPLLPSSTLARQEALRALSQTCRVFRDKFLSVLWDRFEVCATLGQVETPAWRDLGEDKGLPSEDLNRNFDLSGAWYKDIAEALETKSKGLQQSLEHAKLVHKVSVALTRCNAPTALGAFVRCLHALPNLHTLQILRAHTQMTGHLKSAFDGHSFPAIQTIVLPSHAHNVLRCCPEVKTVVCNYDDGSKLVSAIAKGCKKVQRLEGFRPDEKMMKRIVKAAPNLQEIKFGSLVNAKTLGMLSSLKNIRSIELITLQTSPENIVKDLELVACIKLARDMLRKASGKAWLGVHHEGHTAKGVTSTSWSKELEVATS